MKRLLILVPSVFLITGCSLFREEKAITKIELHLDNFGVESLSVPMIDVVIDFVNDTSHCKRSFDSPKYKSNSYRLSRADVEKVKLLLESADLDKLKKEYTTNQSDQPTVYTKVYKGDKKILIKDYALIGDAPMPEIYKLVFKLDL